VEHRLGGREDKDGVGFDQSGVHAERKLALISKGEEIRTLRIVDFHAPREPPCKLGEDEMLEVLATGTPGQASRDEDGLTLERDAGALELGNDGRERFLPGVPQSARDRQRHGLDDDRDACP
jgi:hypothetical protein